MLQDGGLRFANPPYSLLHTDQSADNYNEKNCGKPENHAYGDLHRRPVEFLLEPDARLHEQGKCPLLDEVSYRSGQQLCDDLGHVT